MNSFSPVEATGQVLQGCSSQVMNNNDDNDDNDDCSQAAHIGCKESTTDVKGTGCFCETEG